MAAAVSESSSKYEAPTVFCNIIIGNVASINPRAHGDSISIWIFVSRDNVFANVAEIDSNINSAVISRYVVLVNAVAITT